MFSAEDISVASKLVKQGITQDSTQTINPQEVICALANELRRGARIPMEEILTPEPPYEDEFEEFIFPEVPWSDDTLHDCNRDLDLIKISGSDEFQAKIRTLIHRYKDIFSMTLRAEPAKVPPMSLDVDVEKWHVPANQRGARLQTSKMQDEMRRHINNMLDQHIIQPSSAPAYSQVLLIPKPDNDTRFCNDLRALNKVHTIEGWPIPNIQQMLRDLGVSKPKYFGIMDLTQGYYQAPLAVSSRAFTAFMTFMGLFEWLRVPMGLKGAPSYFQRTLATVVLVGLIGNICLVYIDDVCVYAQTEKEFLERLEKVFARFEKHNITLKPSKCRFGMREVEFLGRIINEHGISMPPDKKEKVFDFKIPTKGKELKSFIGLCEFFHSHVRDFSSIMKPLHSLLEGYTKSTRNRKLDWNEEAMAAFKTIQDAIAECATLHFVDEKASIYLQTDASNYGIGAYLFQTVDGVEKPVAFLSKTLDNTQLKWTTIEKEGYAIYYAFHKFRYLLRDVPFTLQTDHKNLIYINEAPSQKVMRWKLAIQEFMFDIEHIPGNTNVVADGFSRFCLFPTNDEEESTEQEEDIYLSESFLAPILDGYSLDSKTYQKISKVHNSLVGHFGVNKTYERCKQKWGVWDHMKEDIKFFIKHNCPCCQKMNRLRIPIHTHPFTTATYSIMERVAIDTIGPLPEDEEGNKYIIVFIDCFSRYVQLYAAKSAKGLSAVRALIQFVSQFGCPSQFLSDNGPQYVNELIDEFMATVGPEHVRTMAYSKEENAIVERVNKEVMRHLRAILFEKQIKNKWSLVYPLVQRIINSEVHGTIKVSPAQIVFGNMIDLDRGIFLPHKVSNHKKMKYSQYMSTMLQAQEDIIRIAYENQVKTDLHHMAMHSPLRTEFPINSYVLTRYENLQHKPPSKLHPYKKGPFQVVNITGSVYTVRNLVTNKLEDYHITNLQPFDFDPTKVNPREVANTDQGAIDIDHISDHKCNNNFPKRSGLYTFKVHWADNTITWEPYKSVRRCEALHDYVKSINRPYLIPREFFD